MMPSSCVLFLLLISISICPIIAPHLPNHPSKSSRVWRYLKNITPFVATMVDMGLCYGTSYGQLAYFLLEPVRLSGLDRNIKKAMIKAETTINEKLRLEKSGKKVVGFLLGKSGLFDLAIDNGGSWAAPTPSLIIKPATEYLANPEEFKENLKNKLQIVKDFISNNCSFIKKYKGKVTIFKGKMNDVDDDNNERKSAETIIIREGGDEANSKSQKTRQI